MQMLRCRTCGHDRDGEVAACSFCGGTDHDVMFRDHTELIGTDDGTGKMINPAKAYFAGMPSPAAAKRKAQAEAKNRAKELRKSADAIEKAAGV